MSDDEFERMISEANTDADRSVQFVGILLIAAGVTFVVCSVVFVAKMLLGY